MGFFDELQELNYYDPEGPIAWLHRTDPADQGLTRCAQTVSEAQIASDAAGPEAKRLECGSCWNAECLAGHTQKEAARELEGFLPLVHSLQVPHPNAPWPLTVRNIAPGRWLVVDEVGADHHMVFSPDGTEWASGDEVEILNREACEKATLPLSAAIELARHIQANRGLPLTS